MGTNETTYILSTFLKRQDTGAAFDVLNKDEDIVAAFAWRSAFLTFEALKHRDEQKKPWNSLLVDFYRLSRAHSQYMVVKNFYETLSTTPPPTGSSACMRYTRSSRRRASSILRLRSRCDRSSSRGR